MQCPPLLVSPVKNDMDLEAHEAFEIARVQRGNKMTPELAFLDWAVWATERLAKKLDMANLKTSSISGSFGDREENGE